MDIESIKNKSSFKCPQCGAAAAPLRVESQTDTAIVLALRCNTCAIEWTTEANLPVFVAWVKPDRRQRIRPSGSVAFPRPS